MADITDVENALVAVISQTMYPNGTGQASVAGVPVIVYPGWPSVARLDADLLGFSQTPNVGKIHVSVFPTEVERNTTRYSRDWQTLSVAPTTLTLVVAGQTVTVGGTVSTPQNLAVFVNGAPYTYAVQPADTLTSIATALAALIVVAVPGTTSAGPVVSLPATARIGAVRVGGSGVSIRELRRQERVVKISVWADSPAHRDSVVQPIDVALAALEFLTLTDQSQARIIYRRGPVMDSTQKENLYRRDLDYSVEYATTQTATDYTVVVEQINVSPWIDAATAPSSTVTVNV